LKKIALLIGTATLGLLGSTAGNLQAATTTNGLVSTFAFVALYNPTNAFTVSSNSSGTVLTEKITTKTFKITTKDLLDLLAVEFNTNFPSGAQLAFAMGEDDNFVVLDKNGNVFLDVSTNAADSEYQFGLTNLVEYGPVQSGQMTQTQTTTKTNMAGTFTMAISDYVINYKDGYGNDFHVGGVITYKYTTYEDLSTAVVKSASIVLSGSGGGTIVSPVDHIPHNCVFTKGEWKASGKNLPYY
jgi:hypothetical protein